MPDKVELFRNIPENFFSILTGPLKDIHVDLLYLVYEQYKRTIFVIEKEVVIDIFVEYLEIHNDDEAMYISEKSEYNKDIRERAHQYLMKFCQHGWLQQEQYLDYTYRISIRDYASKILDTFGKIAIGYKMELSGTVLSIYQNLSGEEGGSYFAIHQSFEITLQLISGLKELNHNIKNYIESLMEKDNAKEVLEQIFNEYGEKILGKHYYRLKSSDHISKYRSKIIDRIRELRHNERNILYQAEQMLKDDFASTQIECENILFNWLETIEFTFENIYDVLNEIDERNRKYHRAAITQIKFHINKTGHITSKLNQILTYMANVSRNDNQELKELLEIKISQHVDLFKQEYIDKNSIKVGSERRTKITPQPMKNRTINPEAKKKKLKEFQHQMKNEITVQKMNAYINQVLKDNQQKSLAEFPFDTKEDYVNIIFTLLHSTNQKANYKLALRNMLDKKINVPNGTIPNMEVLRKEKKNGMG